MGYECIISLENIWDNPKQKDCKEIWVAKPGKKMKPLYSTFKWLRVFYLWSFIAVVK